MELKMYSALAAKYSVRNSDSDVSQSPSHSSVSSTQGDVDNSIEKQANSNIGDSVVNAYDGTKEITLETKSQLPSTSPKRFKEDKPIPSQPDISIVPNFGDSVMVNDTPTNNLEMRKSIKTEKCESKQCNVTLKDEVSAKILDTDGVMKEAGAVSPKRDVRRLRSHKSIPINETNEEIIDLEPVAEKPSEKPREPTPEKVDADLSPIPTPVHDVADAVLGPVLELGSAAVTLNEKIMSWRIIPEDGCGFYPCKIYGATHLARLFVKLPDFLSAVKMDEEKLKSLLPRIQIFADYLEDHPEWFGEFNYFEEPTVPAEPSTELTTEV